MSTSLLPADRQPATDSARPVATATFIAAVIAHVMADFAGQSVWPVYKTLARLDIGIAGWIATVASMSGTALQPMFSALADRVGWRRTVLLGTLLTTATLLLGPIAMMRGALDARVPAVLGLSGFYVVVFVVLAAGRLGQDIFHPVGAALAGSFSRAHGSTFVAVFVAVGSIGFAFSQMGFSLTYRRLGGHTEWLLIPAGLMWLAIWRGCRPVEISRSDRPGLLAAMRTLSGRAGAVLTLFAILSMSAGVLTGLYFLMPEFAHERHYPLWIGQGGAFGLIVAGSTVFMVPMGHLADRIGRRRTLIAMMAMAAVSYYAIVGLSLSTAAFAALCVVGGAFLGTVNPLGVAFGQRLAPRESLSVVSAVLMGWAWCAGSTAPSIVGQIFKHTGRATTALLWLGIGNVAMVLLGLLLPRSKDVR